MIGARKTLVCLRCGIWVKPSRLRCPKCRKAVIRLIDDRFEPRRFLRVKNGAVAIVAWDRRERREVFVRALLPNADVATNRAVAIEGGLLRKLTGSPGFPSFIHAGRVRETGALYTVQEYVAGETLLQKTGKTSVSNRLECFIHTLPAAAGLHAAGYVHCVISLDHILVSPDGKVVLLDLRQARMVGIESGGSGVAGYRAPEQCLATHRVSPATDVFALGVCAYRLLTGRFPYGKKARMLWRPGAIPRRPSQLDRTITAELDDVILQALARNPEERFPSVEEFYTALQSAFGTRTVVDGLPYKFPSRPRRFVEAVFRCVITSCRVGVSIARFMANQVVRAGRGYTRLVCALTGLRPVTVALSTAALVAVMPFVCIGLRYTAAPDGKSVVASGDVHSSIPAPQTVLPPIPAEVEQSASIQFLTWPPADVYLDERYIVEAPSPEEFSITPGSHRIELASKNGQRRWITADVRQGVRYVLKFDFESGQLDFQEVIP